MAALPKIDYSEVSGHQAEAFFEGTMSRKSLFSVPFGILAGLGSSGGCKHVTPEQAFWTWFQNNQNALFDFEKDREKTFDRLSAEMHKVNANLILRLQRTSLW